MALELLEQSFRFVVFFLLILGPEFFCGIINNAFFACLIPLLSGLSNIFISTALWSTSCGVYVFHYGAVYAAALVHDHLRPLASRTLFLSA